MRPLLLYDDIFLFLAVDPLFSSCLPYPVSDYTLRANSGHFFRKEIDHGKGGRDNIPCAGEGGFLAMPKTQALTDDIVAIADLMSATIKASSGWTL